MIDIKQLSVHYGDFKALDINRRILIEPHDRIGIIGSNGSGKTTLIKALLGLIKNKGDIQTQLSKKDMSVHMQQNEYVETMKIKSIIQAILTKEQLVSDKYGELITYFEFEKHLNKKYTQLSGGEKQRLTIILVLMQDTTLTIFDEVTTGLDFETRSALMDKLLNWYSDKPSSIILITHYYEELDRLANKLLILDKGKLIDYGEKVALFKKYCGYSVIVYKDDTQKLFDKRKKLIAPQPYQAIPCESNVDEMEVIKVLNEKGINFKRTNHDIELLYLNALKGSKQ